MECWKNIGRGFPGPGGVVQIVPAAVLFDLMPLGKFTARPTAELAYRACDDAKTSGIEEGSVGAGTGARWEKLPRPARCMKGGIGIAVSGAAGSGVMAAAIVAVNAAGHVRGMDGAIIAGPRGDDGKPMDAERIIAAGPPPAPASAGTNTTLAVVALNIALTKLELFQSRSRGKRGGDTTGGSGRRARASTAMLIFAVAPMEGRGGALLQAGSRGGQVRSRRRS